MSTNFVNRVAIHPTAETAMPALAALGSNIAQATWSGAGWTTLGSVNQHGDDVDLDADSIDTPFLAEEGIIQPPRSMTREETVAFQSGADAFEIPCYDTSQDLMDLDSNADSDGVVWEKGGTMTYRAVAIEIAGLAVKYFPKCLIRVMSDNGGYAGDNPGKVTLQVVPHATSTIPGGMQKHYYS